jgi:hypothetical protein
MDTAALAAEAVHVHNGAPTEDQHAAVIEAMADEEQRRHVAEARVSELERELEEARELLIDADGNLDWGFWDTAAISRRISAFLVATRETQ